MLKVIAVGFMALALAGCPKNGGTITCPSLKQYSTSFLKEAEQELGMIERNAPNIVKMLNDYGVQRDAIRKCLALQKKFRS